MLGVSASAAGLVARWRLDEANPPYVDSGSHAIALISDPATAAPINSVGIEGAAAVLNWQTSPGVATRLSGSSAYLRSDSFGFSFWISAVNLNPSDNFIALEIPEQAGAGFTRMAWQVHVGNNDGSGRAPIEFLVRGANRTAGDFFGSVLSSVLVPLFVSNAQWLHIAGGYDATTGRLSLFVNGVETASNETPGASNALASTLAVGSVRNGAEFVAFSAQTLMDDLRFYDGPLSAGEVQTLMENPNRMPKLVAHWKLNEPAPPYSGADGNGTPLGLDVGTTTPQTAEGVDRDAVRLRWENPPGISTRLAAYSPEVQTDTFGFSFWVHPVYLAAGDNLIGKEMLVTGSGGVETRLAWQVKVGGNDGAGRARLELVVRGCDRSQGEHFGGVSSTVKVPLFAEDSQWYHVAGGYDSETGELTLTVNGSRAAFDGLPGAHSSDGGALVLGSMVNGAAFVAFAGIADVDDVQIYEGPLSAADVAALMARPGRTLGDSGNAHLPATLVSHWKFDEAGPVYGDWSGKGSGIEADNATTLPIKIPGVDGDGIAINWQAVPGITTRLFSSGNSLQTDSFGFSFWLRPTFLSAGENIIAKEMAPTSGADFTRLAWQVQTGHDNGSGRVPLELVVRGGDRTQGNFFGNVISTTTLPLHAPMDEWVHVTGGYDAVSGQLRIALNGVESVGNGAPGARHADGSWISVGSLRNGLDFVGFGTIASIDEVQLYDRPLSAYDTAFLRQFPGRQVTHQTEFRTTDMIFNADGGVTVSFNSNDGWFYSIEASTDLATYLPVELVSGYGSSTTVILSDAKLDAAMGTAPRARLFVRVRALLPDPLDDSVGFPAAEILPFTNTGLYVPQFHFSLPGAAVGDPNGVVRYQNKFHIFTWDHAASDDLVSWSFLGWPMRDQPADAGFWTGSVVVDLQNTSGFGSLENPPMVALYTIHDNETHQETIGMAYSTDHLNFYNYSGNPVLVSDDVVFRDPDVFWDAARNRWFMSVARSEAKTVHFYTSTDLKAWHFEGAFGPEGARNEIWEVPGLVEVPIKGMGNQKKWLFYIGAGTNKVQYFVGDFDGERFIMDDATRLYLNEGTGLEGEVFASFEGVRYDQIGWTTTGSAFGEETGWRGQPGQPVSGYLGNRLASSYVNGDFHINSTLTSPTFVITRNCINFLIAGGNHPGLECINLLVNGNVVRSSTGDDSDVLKWAGWNVAEFVGQEARIQLVDNFDGFWSRIYIDHIMFSDILMDDRREHANWVDWGSDFFAPKVVRDYDGTATEVQWLGWIGSWLYEAFRPEPETWGKGSESIFRKLQLAPSAKGYQLVQKPIDALQRLRGSVVNVTPRSVNGTVPLTAFQPATNTYEVEASFSLTGAGERFGFNLCVSNAPQRVVVGYDSKTSNIYLDRTMSGYVTFGPGFQTTTNAPYKPVNGVVKLRIFVDQTSIEVFAGDGERVFTSQIYPDPAGVGIELFSTGGPTTLQSMKAWPLASIWQ